MFLGLPAVGSSSASFFTRKVLFPYRIGCFMFWRVHRTSLTYGT